MEPIAVFSNKAGKYSRYRWDYAQQAVQTIFDLTRITHQSSVADIGAGTGILTKHFVGKVRQVFAIEPNAEMRKMGQKVLAPLHSCQFIDGRAESTTLPDHCVDLITVAQAVNWFQPQATRTEFGRILKPSGWLAILRNYGDNLELNAAVERIYPEVTDTTSLMKGRGIPFSFYFGGNDYLRHMYRFTRHETWEEFIGALSTASYAPDESSSLYDGFERAARIVFDCFSINGFIEMPVVTELNIGHIFDER